MACVKVVVLGLGAVGKSALSIRFVQNTFVPDYEPTISNTYKKATTVDGKTYSVDILDTAGMDNNDTMKPVLYRQRDCFLFIYAINDRASFESIQKIHDEVLRVNDKNKVPCVLCGNKSDLEDQRQISVEEGKDLAKQINAVFLETSALSGSNVQEAMTQAVREYVKTLAPEDEGKKQEEKKKRKKFCLIL